MITLVQFYCESFCFGKRLGLRDDEICVISVYSPQQFADAWNSIESDDNLTVVINTHGNLKSMGTEKDSYIYVGDVGNLQKKYLKNLVLLGCNCGHLDSFDENIANTFAGKVNCDVYAADGTVSAFGNIYNTVGDSHFKDGLRREIGRRPKGWIVYNGGSGGYYCINKRIFSWEWIK